MGVGLFGVLGPVVAWDRDGREVDLRGPRHRAVLARLLVARGRVVPVGHLVDDLWVVPPAGAVPAVRTFVAALRRALEPDRPPRSRPAVLVTEGPGYALRAAPDAVDAWRFEDAVAAGGPLGEALGWWRGPAYANFGDEPWARSERARLTELRLRAVEMEASRLLSEGRPADAIPQLDAHVTDHPWREEAWRLLALALYRTGRQGDALAVLRRARDLLSARLGVDPGPALSRLERDILRQEKSLDAAGEVWSAAAEAYGRFVAVGTRARLETTVGLLRSLAVSGGGDGLGAAQEQRPATIRAAEELGDPLLTARVIGAYDVPAVWPRADDPARAAEVVAAARRTLRVMPHGPTPAATRPAVGVGVGEPAARPDDRVSPRTGAGLMRTSGKRDPAPGVSERARLLATVAVEARGTGAAEDREAAEEAVLLARQAEDPALLAFALNGLYMQTFHRCGLAAERDAIGAELVELAARHSLPTAEVLGHLIRVQTRSALGEPDAAAAHADAADRLAARHELPLVAVFTTLRRASSADAYRAARSILDRAGMPGLTDGLLPLALFALGDEDQNCGPYEPWVRGSAIDPPHDPMAEILWCLTARAAIRRGDRAAASKAREALRPAAGEYAANGLLDLGPIRDVLTCLDRHIDV
ncbi:BTAD domain-containing putative transcriptional regulator [Actinoplanes sp. NPDC051343]|uniref:AfsR/SARP family transcriptional regulator n=1 Tax=Actinoplanes sp. NPDC051343 TaxID=3363906 RepID=UPI00378C6815